MDDLEALLRLSHIPGVGSATIRKLFARFGAAAAVWDAGGGAVVLLLGEKLLEAWRCRHALSKWRKICLL